MTIVERMDALCMSIDRVLDDSSHIPLLSSLSGPFRVCFSLSVSFVGSTFLISSRWRTCAVSLISRELCNAFRGPLEMVPIISNIAFERIDREREDNMVLGRRLRELQKAEECQRRAEEKYEQLLASISDTQQKANCFDMLTQCMSR